MAESASNSAGSSPSASAGQSVSKEEASKLSQSKLAGSKDPYSHRSHRVKHQEGYGAEGAARGEHKEVSEKKISKEADSEAHEKSEKKD
jgi:hypothetical protein